jgi:hypothetical protein
MAWLDGMHLAMWVVAGLAVTGAGFCAGVALRRRHREHDHAHPANAH